MSVGDQPGAAKTGCAAPCYDSTHTSAPRASPLIAAFQATAAVEYRDRHRHRRRHRRPAHRRRHRRQQHQAELGHDHQRRPGRSRHHRPRRADRPDRRCRATPRPRLSWAAPGRHATSRATTSTAATGPDRRGRAAANRVNTSLVERHVVHRLRPHQRHPVLLRRHRGRHRGQRVARSPRATVTPSAGAGADARRQGRLRRRGDHPGRPATCRLRPGVRRPHRRRPGDRLSYGWVGLGTIDARLARSATAATATPQATALGQPARPAAARPSCTCSAGATAGRHRPGLVGDGRPQRRSTP